MEESISGGIKEGIEVTPQTELLDLVVDTAEENCNLGVKISLEELGKDGGIYAELGDGYTDTTYFNKQEIKTVPVLFMCRHKSQKKCLEWLFSISNYLQRLKKYPQGETVSWLDTTIAKEPAKIGRDEDGVYHYSCILNCKIYY